jgi:hypothetical protein
MPRFINTVNWYGKDEVISGLIKGIRRGDVDTAQFCAGELVQSNSVAHVEQVLLRMCLEDIGPGWLEAMGVLNKYFYPGEEGQGNIGDTLYKPVAAYVSCHKSNVGRAYYEYYSGLKDQADMGRPLAGGVPNAVTQWLESMGLSETYTVLISCLYNKAWEDAAQELYVLKSQTPEDKKLVSAEVAKDLAKVKKTGYNGVVRSKNLMTPDNIVFLFMIHWMMPGNIHHDDQVDGTDLAGNLRVESALREYYRAYVRQTQQGNLDPTLITLTAMWIFMWRGETFDQTHDIHVKGQQTMFLHAGKTLTQRRVLTFDPESCMVDMTTARGRGKVNTAEYLQKDLEKAGIDITLSPEEIARSHGPPKKYPRGIPKAVYYTQHSLKLDNIGKSPGCRNPFQPTPGSTPNGDTPHVGNQEKEVEPPKKKSRKRKAPEKEDPEETLSESDVKRVETWFSDPQHMIFTDETPMIIIRAGKRPNDMFQNKQSPFRGTGLTWAAFMGHPVLLKGPFSDEELHTQGGNAFLLDDVKRRFGLNQGHPMPVHFQSTKKTFLVFRNPGTLDPATDLVPLNKWQGNFGAILPKLIKIILYRRIVFCKETTFSNILVRSSDLELFSVNETTTDYTDPKEFAEKSLFSMFSSYPPKTVCEVLHQCCETQHKDLEGLLNHWTSLLPESHAKDNTNLLRDDIRDHGGKIQWYKPPVKSAARVSMAAADQ